MKIKYAVLVCLLSLVSFAQTIEIPEFATDLWSVVEITNAGDSRLFAVQLTGEIRILNPDGTLKPNNFLTLDGSTIMVNGERGLLGLAFHPQYATNGYFYVYYSRVGDATSVLARYSVDPANPDVALSDSGVVLLTIAQSFPIHKGGSLHFGPDGYLYIGTGDGGNGGDQAQNIHSNLGKMLRIDVDNPTDVLPYGIPPTNPYANTDGNDEIWAVGFRNPWKYSFDRNTGDLWIADVGEDTTEEINHVSSSIPGLNFGWHCYEGDAVFTNGCTSNDITYTFPIGSYPHGDDSCSITGGYVYTGTQYPDMLGKYFFADYCSHRIGMVDVNTNAISYSETFEGDHYFTTFGQDVNGELYIAASGTGKIHRVVDGALGVNTFAAKLFSLAPNPAASEFFIKMRHGNFPATLSVIDVSGKKLLEQAIDSDNTPISAEFQNGIYVVTVKDKTGAVSSAKLAITR